MSLKIVIVGGVAGGMSAATRARRLNEDASITVLERGGFISFANCGLPYYLGGIIPSEETLLITTPQRVRGRFNIDVRVRHEVTGIDRQHKEVEVFDHVQETSYRLGYDKLILAPGASPIIPPIENVNAPNVFPLRSMEDARRAHAWINRQNPPRSVAIVGAGFIGLELAETLRHRGLAVTLIEKAPQVLPPLDAEIAWWVKAELESHDVEVITGTGLKSLRAKGALVDEVELEDGRIVPADMVVLSIGVRPNTDLAKRAGLTIGPAGGIVVDAYQRSSDSDIYAVGDASEVIHTVTGQPARIPLAGPANRHGRLAGEHAATGNSAPAAGVSGTAVVQVFGLTVAMTGLSERAACAADLPGVETAYVMPGHHAAYYPDARQMRMKLVYQNETGRILGAQVIGSAGVDKRIDVIATAIQFGGTVESLSTLDLAYAPQFSSAKDPIHMLAMVAQNQRRGLVKMISAQQVNGQVLLDVRTPDEFNAGTLPRAINIPVDELRGRLAELDPARPTVVFCQIGMRGYIAQRILTQHGFQDVRNIKGGYALASQYNTN